MKNKTTTHLFNRITGSLCALLFAVTLQAQDAQVQLPAREVTVKQSFDEIQRQTSYRYMINWSNIHPDKRVFFPHTRVTVKELLDGVLAGSGYTYQIKNNHIVLVADIPQTIYAPVPSPMLARSSTPTRKVQSMSGELYQKYDPSRMKIVADPWSHSTMHLDLSGYNTNGSWIGAPNDSATVGVVMIHFRVNQTVLERNYMDNARSLDIIDKTFSNIALMEDMDYMTITAAASPEGNTAHNEQLAAGRAMAIKAYIMWKYPYINRDRIITFSAGEDWEGLIRMIEQDPNVPHRGELLFQLRSIWDNDAKRAAMKRVGNGSAYRYLHSYMLPYLRGGAACMIYFKKDRIKQPEPPVQKEIIEKVRIDTIYIEKEKVIYTDPPIVQQEVKVAEPVVVYEQQAVKVYENPFYIALKNNLLFDAALLPNVAIEIPFGRDYGYSAELEGHWSWWDTGAEKYNFHRIQMVGLELRKWFGNRTGNPLNGWYAGVYGYGGTYDVRMFAKENKDKGYLSDWSYSAGLSLGYAKPISRRMNLEFGLGLGYFGGEYKKYNVSECNEGVYPWLSTHKRSYFGLTKAKVSLVWLIGTGVNKPKK